MKRLVLILMLMMVLPVMGQDYTATTEPEATEEAHTPFVGEATVNVESAFVRVLPDQDSEAVASVFEHDILEVVGRNLDGLWFEVRRPNRIFNLGWISAGLLKFDFPPEALPMTDSETGLLGASPIPENNIPVVITAEANLRAGDVLSADIVAVIPLGAVIPAIGRDFDGTWIYVNFRGTEGWLNSSVYRRPPNLMDLPDVTAGSGDAPQLPAIIIPPDIQLDQLERFRAFVQSSVEVSGALVPFWEMVAEGEVMPCEPPDFVQNYLITRDDVRELPELNRYVPRFNEGVQLLNEAIAPLYVCGVLMPDVVIEARNDAINSTIIFNATLDVLDQLEELIREQNNLDPATQTASN